MDMFMRSSRIAFAGYIGGLEHSALVNTRTGFLR
jgi:hypothetical protein